MELMELNLIGFVEMKASWRTAAAHSTIQQFISISSSEWADWLNCECWRALPPIPEYENFNFQWRNGVVNDENEIEFLWIGGLWPLLRQWLRQEKKTIQFHLIHETTKEEKVAQLTAADSNTNKLIYLFAAEENGPATSGAPSGPAARQAKGANNNQIHSTRQWAAPALNWNWVGFRGEQLFFSSIWLMKKKAINNESKEGVAFIWLICSFSLLLLNCWVMSGQPLLCRREIPFHSNSIWIPFHSLCLHLFYWREEE